MKLKIQASCRCDVDEQGDVSFHRNCHRCRWQSVGEYESGHLAGGCKGEYSGFAEGIPAENLRAVLFTDENGKFEIQTVVPGDYSIPTDGPTGKFLT